MDNITRQELFCHECKMYVQFSMDMDCDGEHVLNCPNCGHEHCRTVRNGVITEERWDSRNNDSGFQTFQNTWSISATSLTCSGVSTFDMYTGGTTAVAYSDNTSSTASDSDKLFFYQSWNNTIA
jgi:hypothetical protein